MRSKKYIKMKNNEKDNIYWKLLADSLANNLSAEQEAQLHQLIEEDSTKKRIYDAMTDSNINIENSLDNTDEQEILHMMYNKIFDKEIKRNSTKRFWMNGLRIVASIAILISVGIISFYIGGKGISIGQEEWIEFYCQNGGYTKLYLQDSSEVYVNAGSTLRYPAKFTKNKRVVEIEGEAFFNVTKDSERPFYVKSNLFEAKVLGTSFNTKSYKNDSVASVTLSTGSVEVTINNSHSKCVLKANEHIEITANTTHADKKHVNTDYYTAWKEGNLSFYKITFKELCKILERKYGVNIILNNKDIANNIYTGRFINNEGLYQVLDLIKHNKNFNYRLEENNVLIIY